MRRIAIFVEGQSALIFVRQMLFLLIDNSKLSFDCWEWHGYELRLCLKFHHYSSPDPDVHFTIIDSRNDEGVLTALKERERGLLKKGIGKIICLRDMYSENYRKRAGSNINDQVTNAFINEWERVIQGMSDPSKIKIHVSIMELEAWFLGMYSIFERINAKLSVDYILDRLGFDLRSVDPQNEFFHPKVNLGQILDLVKVKYDTSRAHIEKICSQIKLEDFNEAFERGRCSNFKKYYEEILD